MTSIARTLSASAAFGRSSPMGSRALSAVAMK
jgi:hypothetical protein